MQDGPHRFQDGFGGKAVAVVHQPLDISDPDGDLRQFVSVLVDFNAMQLGRRDRDKESTCP